MFLTKSNENISAVLFQISFSSYNISCLLSVVCLSSIVIIMAVKRVSSKSEDSFDEIFNIFYSKSEDLYDKTDNSSARIKSLLELELDIRSADLSFSNVFKFLELFNFLSGEFDLLYHSQIKVGEAIMGTRDGYSHDFLLQGNLSNIKKQINRVSKSNPNKKIRHMDMKFVPNGKILDDGLKSLKSKFNELKRNLQRKFEIIIKETGSNSPYV